MWRGLGHATFKLHGELPGCPHHVPDDDYEEKVTSSVEKARTGMRLKQYGQHWFPPILGVPCKLEVPTPNIRGRF